MGTNIPTSGSGLTPAQATVLSVIGSDWMVKEQANISAVFPGITNFKPFPVGQLAAATTTPPATTTDPQIEGGGIFANNASGATYFTNATFLHFISIGGSVSFIAYLLGGGATGHDSEVCVINSTGLHVVAMMRRNATSASKYALELIGTSSPPPVAGLVTADSNAHVFTLVSNAGAMTMMVDGTIDATSTNNAGLTDEPFFPGLYSVTVKEAVVVDCMIGTVGLS